MITGIVVLAVRATAIGASTHAELAAAAIAPGLAARLFGGAIFAPIHPIAFIIPAPTPTP